MNTHEEQLALELDAFLTAQLQKRPLPPSLNPEVQAEADLALELLDLAQSIEPAPLFLSDLAAELDAVARRPERTPAPKLAETPFWQNFLQSLGDLFSNKRALLALGGLTAVVVTGLFVYLALNGQPGAPIQQPLAAEEGAPTAAVPEVIAAASSPTPDLSSLPKLPRMGTGNMGMGGGMGGGGDMTIAAEPGEGDSEGGALVGEEPVVEMPGFWNPLADAAFAVNVPFPTEPAFATVFQQPAGSTFTLEEIQRYAQLFGVNGPIYQEQYTQPVYEDSMPEVGRWTPPTFYYVFDGMKQLSFYENNIYYFDQEPALRENLQMMPFAQAAPIVEAYLRERGLLNFPYVVASYWGSDVEIRRVVNGYPSSSAEFYVSVTADGIIYSISYQPFDNLQPLGEYPLRSAADAWQYVQENGFDYMTSYWFTYPGPDAPAPVMHEPVATPWDEIYRYWPRTFNEGDAIVLVSYPIVYTAVNGDAPPRILVDQYRLTGNSADLEALTQYAGQPVRIEGIVRGQTPNLLIELSAWRPAPDQMWQYLTGTIRRDGEQVYFDADDGETFIVPNAPADVADGERVNLSGWSLEETGGQFRAFNWSSMDRYVDWEALPPEILYPEQGEMGQEYRLTNVTITEISLVYQFSPTYSEEGYVTAFLMQPAWRFKGVTNNANEMIEIMVQAVAPEFVESSNP